MSEDLGILAGLRVVVVEDEALIAIAVEDEARNNGASEIHIAPHQQAAMEAIELFSLDFAILDVSLNDEGEDYAIADHLAERGIPFIFSSGHLASELPDRHAGRPFVTKPMQPSEFVEAVRMALRV